MGFIVSRKTMEQLSNNQTVGVSFYNPKTRNQKEKKKKKNNNLGTAKLKDKI